MSASLVDFAEADAPATRRLTVRAIAVGMALGGVLSLCNIYSGLKIGFTTNMSIAAALLGFGTFWAAHRVVGSQTMGLQENAVQQTAASAAASIAGAGLVAPIPALTMLTHTALPYGWLVAWTLAVSFVGVLVGVGLRKHLVVSEKLPFPYGVATAEMLREMYGRGNEALQRTIALLSSLTVAALIKLAIEIFKWTPIPLGGRLPLSSTLLVRAKNLGVAFDPSVLMIGVGGLIGMRAAASMLFGALLAWVVLTPWVLGKGWVVIPPDMMEGLWFGALREWLLWPGIALMVSAALTSFAISMVRMVRTRRAKAAELSTSEEASAHDVSPRAFQLALFLAAAFAVTLQIYLFNIVWYLAVAAVFLSFGLGVVAGRVAGEVGIAPIGAMGKVTQLTFAGLNPGNATSNLMAANVTGGAASQCADMLHDLKAGHELGVWPRHQAIAQAFGVLAGALAGSAAYLLLVPDPSTQLLTPQWPAPAVAEWKAVAEVFTKGLGHMPVGSMGAAAVGACAGVLLALMNARLPLKARGYLPSAPSVGLAFVLPAYYSISVFLGALMARMVFRVAPSFAQRFVVVLAAGLIAGESLSGVALAVHRMLMGG